VRSGDNIVFGSFGADVLRGEEDDDILLNDDIGSDE
jgi:RTX calcium-binding nonapeptide repeat (4 copies)